jgi:hypothetical protein
MAILGIAEYVPPILVGLIAGVWIDRLRRRPLLIGANLARALVLVVLAIASAAHVLRVDVLYAAGVVLGALDVMFVTAFAAYLPSLVVPASLVTANAARATGSAAADVVGPTVAGVLIQVLGTAGALAVDGASFLASVTGLALVRTPEAVPRPRPARRRLARELVEGLQLLLGHPMLRAFTLTAFTANFFYRIVMTVYVLHLIRDLALSPAVIGLIFGFGGGAGVLLGPASAGASHVGSVAAATAQCPQNAGIVVVPQQQQLRAGLIEWRKANLIGQDNVVMGFAGAAAILISALA